ncbi:hypothetical protein [Pseudohongiella sp. O18]|uniref:hypothetical protein n=1 Tax=Pseudohongiella sp. O18 TaxID=2904248 RepID=UPI001F400F4D|nr:hypothetical protein [Pseudohongiella sp. O18]
MSISREAIEDTVKNGLIGDIFRFERALALKRKIASHSELINDTSNGNYGLAFRTIDSSLSTEAILAASRINDNPSKKYPTRCLRGLLSYLEKYHEELPDIREEFQLLHALSAREGTETLLHCVKHSPNEFSGELRRYVIVELESTPLLEYGIELRNFRDKALAHNENAENVNSPFWSSIKEIVELAKFVVGVLGWSYLSTAYSVSGEYILTSDALRPSLCIDRLIGDLYGI